MLDALLAINDKLANGHVTGHLISQPGQQVMKPEQTSPQINSAGRLVVSMLPSGGARIHVY